jgi:hypothetical protein
MSKNDKVPLSKPFPWKCGHCRERAVFPDRVPYTVEVVHDGRSYTVTLPELKTPRCRNCGELLLDSEASRQISEAFRAQANLLTPEHIRQAREELGLTQKQLPATLR